MDPKFIDMLFEKEMINKDQRTITGIITSDIIDRDGEIVSAEAVKNAMTGFMKNPVVIIYHKHKLESGEPTVVGKIIKWWQENGKTWATIEFAKTDMAEKYWILYSQGFQKAFSIGFRSIKRENLSINGKSVLTHTEIEIYELSLVAVGANQESMTKEIAAMEARIIKSLADRLDKTFVEFSSLKAELSNLKSELVEQFDQVKDLMLPNSDGVEPPPARWG